MYRRTYMTVLRSTGETWLRVLEASHKAMHSSLHPLGDTSEPDLGAFLYAVRRLPAAFRRPSRGHGPVCGDLRRSGFCRLPRQPEVGAPGRRRRWYDAGTGTLAVFISSASDVDDLIPTLVAFQIEWNKLHSALVRVGRQRPLRLRCQWPGGWAAAPKKTGSQLHEGAGSYARPNP